MNKLFLILIVLILLPCKALAESFNLLDSSIPIASHLRKGGNIKFKKEFNAKEFYSRVLPNVSPENIPEKIPAMSFAYKNFSNQLPAGAGTYDVKPDCTESSTRRIPVVYDSEELKLFDIIYYNYKDKSQTANARAWNLPTAPFLEGDLYNPHRTYNLQQDLGRFFDIRCLPTRVHFPIIDGQRYEEYREGSSAWDK